MSCWLCARPFSTSHHHLRAGVCVDGCSGSSSAIGTVDELPVRPAVMPPSLQLDPIKTVAAGRTTSRVA